MGKKARLKYRDRHRKRKLPRRENETEHHAGDEAPEQPKQHESGDSDEESIGSPRSNQDKSESPGSRSLKRAAPHDAELNDVGNGDWNVVVRKKPKKEPRRDSKNYPTFTYLASSQPKAHVKISDL